jgi:hypothetical protein
VTTVESNFPNRPFRLTMTVVLNSQDIASNSSLVDWNLYINKNSYSPTYSFATSYWSRNVGPQYGEGSFTYDFRNYDSLLLASGQTRITHNADGTGSCAFNGAANVQVMGTASVAGSLPLPRIPRGPLVRYGGTWRNTVAYVRDGGTWKIATPYVRSGGVWKVSGG